MIHEGSTIFNTAQALDHLPLLISEGRSFEIVPMWHDGGFIRVSFRPDRGWHLLAEDAGGSMSPSIRGDRLTLKRSDFGLELHFAQVDEETGEERESGAMLVTESMWIKELVR